MAAGGCSQRPNLDRRTLALVEHLDEYSPRTRRELHPDLTDAVGVGVVHELTDDQLEVVERGGVERGSEMLIDETPGEGGAAPLPR